MLSAFQPFSLSAFAFALLSQAAPGAAPEISVVFPDFATENPSVNPHLITGEAFEPGKTEIWTLDSALDTSSVTNVLESLGDNDPSLPAAPPKEARRIAPLDVERQVIVAPLEGFAVWVRTPAGTSLPYAINLPKPAWISDEQAEPGQTVHLFGFGLRAPWRPCYLALVGPERRYLLQPFAPSRDYRAEDSTLLYLEIPTNAVPGAYRLFVNNSYGGALGWRNAGTLQIIPHALVSEKIFNVQSYGARGDDEENDYAAITNAIASAKATVSANVRPVVYFPPGKWRTDTTLRIPSGVTLRGAGRDLSIIEGFGALPPDRKTTSMVSPSSHTTLESLTFQGFTVKGPYDYWGVLVRPPPQNLSAPDSEPLVDFTIRHCRLCADDSGATGDRAVYQHALGVPRFRNVTILDNDIYGSSGLGSPRPCYRLEWLGNTIHGGGSADNVSLQINQIFDSIVDGTVMWDVPSRFLVNPRRHCAIRFNEVHDYVRGIWANAEESFLVHGDVSKSGGRVIAATHNLLTDSTKHWAPGFWSDAEVLIISGRGFGQHRAVADNTSDTLTLREGWRVTPDATSQYVVGRYFVENSWYANLNDTPGRMSLWLECIGNVIEKHRDNFAGGIDIWGHNRTEANEPVRTRGDFEYVDHHFMPSWFNLIHDGWFDGSTVKLWSGATPPSQFTSPALFGNIIAGNHIREAHMVRTGFEHTPRIDGAIWIGNRSGPDMTHPATNQVALSHTIVAGNVISHTPRGISVSDTAHKTFLIGNEFEAVEHPILNWGSATVEQGNRTYTLDEQGEHLRDYPAPLK